LQGNVLGAALSLLVPSAKLVCSERNVGHNLTGFKRLLEAVATTREDAATANSPAVRDAAVARLPRRATRFHVIPPGVPVPEPPSERRETTAVMVARMHPIKDHATALRVWRRVVERRPAETLTLVGDGPGRADLERAAHELGVASAVRFRGDADPAPDLYGARLLLATSRAEGFSRAVLEALAAGVPVVSTEVGGVAELASPAVRSAPVGDDVALAAHVLDWLDDPNELARAAFAARLTAERFAPARFHEAQARLYAELLAT
jgi:glycosyltransferase involved in cell wall biosynthesis